MKEKNVFACYHLISFKVKATNFVILCSLKSLTLKLPKLEVKYLKTSLRECNF